MSDEEDDSDEEMYSVTSSQAVYKRSRSKTKAWPVPQIRVSSDSDYEPVTRWAVDYNNKNYVRSLCNKNKGLHRKTRGRPLDWKIQYDNSYYNRAKVNSPKGLHRRVPEIKRKYVPDNDDLADATGWEFDCGPEFDQKEHDVCYIPEGRIITRGCYRWYGTKRNDSDCDVKQEEHRQNLLTKELEEELKYGPEFLQADVPHMVEPLGKRYSRGSYRHYEVQRNAHDINREELDSAAPDPEWKRKHHSSGYRYMDLNLSKHDRVASDRHSTVKGKPFRRTILNKVYELRKVEDPRPPKRRGTRITMVPGEGERAVYEGVADTHRLFKSKKAPSIRSVFKKKAESKKYSKGNEYEEYEQQSRETRYTELRPEYDSRSTHRMSGEKRDQRRKYSDEEDRSGSRIFQEYAYTANSEENDGLRRKSTRSSTDSSAREDFEIWRENAANKKQQSEHRYDVNERRSSDRRKEKYISPDYSTEDTEDEDPWHTTTRSSTDAKEDFEIWRENVENRRDQNERAFNVRQSRSEDRKRERYLSHDYTPEDSQSDRGFNIKQSRSEDRKRYLSHDFTPKDIVVEKRSLLEDDYSGSSMRTLSSRGGRESGYGTGHSGRSVRDYDREGSSIHRRGSDRRRQDSFSDEVDPGKDAGLKKFPQRIKQRMEKIRDKMERKLEDFVHKQPDKGDSEDFNFSLSDESIVVEKRNNLLSDFGGSDHRSMRTLSSRDERKSGYGTGRSGRSVRDYDREGSSIRRKGSGRIKRQHHAHFDDEIKPGKGEVLKKLPPHIKERMEQIRDKMERKLEDMARTHQKKGGNQDFNVIESDDRIDLMKHKGHPKDRGQSHNSEYEKYVTKNGSELWVKKEEQIAELHHKDHR